MKYLITILLICSGLLSCTGDLRGVYPAENNIITNAEYIKETQEALYTTSNGGKFWSRRNLYTMGDTLKFTK